MEEEKIETLEDELLAITDDMPSDIKRGIEIYNNRIKKRHEHEKLRSQFQVIDDSINEEVDTGDFAEEDSMEDGSDFSFIEDEDSSSNSTLTDLF